MVQYVRAFCTRCLYLVAGGSNHPKKTATLGTWSISSWAFCRLSKQNTCCLLSVMTYFFLQVSSLNIHPPREKKTSYIKHQTTSTPKNSSCMQVIWIHLVPQQLPGWQVRGGSGGSSPGGFSFSSVDSPSTYRTPYLFRDYFWGFSQKTSVERMWSLACYQISSVK